MAMDVLFKIGSAQAYENLNPKVPTTFYLTTADETHSAELYLGELKLSNEEYDFEALLKDVIGDLADLTTDEKGTIVGAINEINENVGDINTFIEGDYKVIVDGESKEVGLKEYIDTKITKLGEEGYDDTEIRGLIKTNSDTIATLVGQDTGKSVREVALDVLTTALIPEDAKEALDTLEEIAAWIQDHPDSVAEMNKAISDLGDAVDDINDKIGELPEGETTIVNMIQNIKADPLCWEEF